MIMKIQESSTSQLVSATERSATGCFAGRAVSSRETLAEPVSLAAALRRILTMSRAQEHMLDRLLQGEHKPLTERRIRLL
ncbi:hypothetical protein PEKONANI_03289 [Aeromonas jandaei]